MITVEAPVREITDIKNKLDGFLSHIYVIVKDAAEEAKDLIEDRVNGQGLATNGSALMTPSQNPIGRYGQLQGKFREERGLTTQIVNLEVTGELWESWKIETQENETRVGFDQELSRNKAENLQEFIYDTPIFVPSESEMEQVFNSIEQAIIDKLRL